MSTPVAYCPKCGNASIVMDSLGLCSCLNGTCEFSVQFIHALPVRKFSGSEQVAIARGIASGELPECYAKVLTEEVEEYAMCKCREHTFPIPLGSMMCICAECSGWFVHGTPKRAEQNEGEALVEFFKGK